MRVAVGFRACSFCCVRGCVFGCRVPGCFYLVHRWVALAGFWCFSLVWRLRQRLAFSHSVVAFDFRFARIQPRVVAGCLGRCVVAIFLARRLRPLFLFRPSSRPVVCFALLPGRPALPFVSVAFFFFASCACLPFLYASSLHSSVGRLQPPFYPKDVLFRGACATSFRGGWAFSWPPSTG